MIETKEPKANLLPQTLEEFGRWEPEDGFK